MYCSPVQQDVAQNEIGEPIFSDFRDAILPSLRPPLELETRQANIGSS